MTVVKPDIYDASNHASCLVDGDARTTSNICTCKRSLCLFTSMEHVSVLVYARKLRILYFSGAKDAMRVNSQQLYILAKMLWVYQCFECFIKKLIIPTVNEFSSKLRHQNVYILIVLGFLEIRICVHGCHRRKKTN